MNSTGRFVLILVALYVVALTMVYANSNERLMGPCIRNCAQCKKMFGPYFLGEKCAESCIKFKGKFIPDCEDEETIRSFLTPFNASDNGLTNDKRICRVNCQQCKDDLGRYFRLDKCNAYCNSTGEYKVVPDLMKPNTLTRFLIPVPANNRTEQEDVCIVNCIQCKQMYPNNFYIGMCSDYCLSDIPNKVMPDCIVANTIVDFIHMNNATDNDRTEQEDVCITKCVQCKEIYPHVFNVAQCSKYCLSNVPNKMTPDCNVLSMITDFIHVNNAADTTNSTSSG